MNTPTRFLRPENCCLLVIDPQERLMAAIHKANRVTDNTVILVHCARALKMPVITTTQYKKGLGPFVPELEELLKDDPSADKTEFNALANPKTLQLLNNLPEGVDTLILAGAEAHICIYQTALGALKAGYRTWVAADAVSSREKRNVRMALDRMRSLGIETGPTEMIVYELLHKAGTPAFKAMLPHLK